MGDFPLPWGVRFLDPHGAHRTPEVGEGVPLPAFSSARQFTGTGKGLVRKERVLGRVSLTFLASFLKSVPDRFSFNRGLTAWRGLAEKASGLQHVLGFPRGETFPLLWQPLRCIEVNRARPRNERVSGDRNRAYRLGRLEADVSSTPRAGRTAR